MAGTILSPIAIWEDFIVPENFVVSLINEYDKGDFKVEQFYIEGRKTESGTVRIFATSVKKRNSGKLPAVFLLKDFKENNVLDTLFDLASEGYYALTVDIEGDKNDLNYCTVYPADISYANYENVKDNLYLIDESVKKSCWYEWCAVLKYAFGYFKSLNEVDKLGVIASGESATVLWQALANQDKVDSAVILYNAGWKSYKGNYKYDEKADDNFDDNTLVCIAGIEPQSYAQYVNCPMFIISNPNDPDFDADRVHDTVKRVNTEKKGILYEPKCKRGLTQNTINTLKIFLEDTLINYDNPQIIIEPNISTNIENGECLITVESFDKRVKSIKLYCAEEQFASLNRVYFEQTEYEKEENQYLFKYMPYQKSKRIMVFANVEYENGGTISTNIDFIDFDENEIKNSFKSPVIYSSRIDGGERVFVQNEGIKLTNTFSSKDTVLSVKNGAEQIKGVSIKGGITTFALMIEKFKPTRSSLLLFDFFFKKESEITVKAFVDYNGDKTEYMYSIKSQGGNTWQNVKLDASCFKTEDGRGLKDISEIEVLEFYSDSDVLINNLLLV